MTPSIDVARKLADVFGVTVDSGLTALGSTSFSVSEQRHVVPATE
jgi:hypothetical protein